MLGKQRLLPEIPLWVKNPDYDRVDWLNKFIEHMWPYLDKAICKTAKNIAKPIIAEQIPKYKIESVEFEALTLGDSCNFTILNCDGRKITYSLEPLSTELLLFIQKKEIPIHSKSQSAKPPYVLNNDQVNGGAPNVSDAYTINGQPGDLYNCSSKAQGHIDVVNLLLDADSNLAKIARNNGKTVLHTAARMGH
ncbi:hypothetical protein POM88_039061 [Heracleum sosnowskyi]|uniref:Uncharacterized protein n=1 Tax=Heracleum sosnowskyi TaxID=360622 RepID=A0AAD8H9P5_9APIA|nr:hypothetical protein POM88_039061 [Heracleum sosnowskyi]